MNDDEIMQMAIDHGFEGQSLDLVMRLAKEVERETRYNYFNLIQSVNNATCSKLITTQKLDAFIWNNKQNKVDN